MIRTYMYIWVLEHIGPRRALILLSAVYACNGVQENTGWHITGAVQVANHFLNTSNLHAQLLAPRHRRIANGRKFSVTAEWKPCRLLQKG